MPYQAQAAVLANREALKLGAASSKGPFRSHPASIILMIMLLPLAKALLNVQVGNISYKEDEICQHVPGNFSMTLLLRVSASCQVRVLRFIQASLSSTVHI